VKKLLVLIVLALAVWVGVNYVRTGKVSLFPVELSAEQREIQELEEELRSIDKQMAQAGRAAGLTGVDTSADVSGLMERKQRIQERLAELHARSGH
jgi:hypothetical protein